MDNFNMKQWLQENKTGPFRKVSLNEMNPAALGMGQEKADGKMLAKDSQKGGDWIDNASMDVMAEASSKSAVVDIDEWEVSILGKDHMIDAEVDTYYSLEGADYLDGRMIDAGGVVIEKAVAKITSLQVEDGDSYRVVNDPVYIKQIEDLINKDPKLNRSLEDEVASRAEDLGAEDGEGDEYEPDDFNEASSGGMDPAASSKKRVDFIRLLYNTKRYGRDELIDIIDELLFSASNEMVAKVVDKVEKEMADHEKSEYPDYADYGGGTNETVGYVMKTKESDPNRKF